MSSLADFQNEIYLNGLADVRPELPTSLIRLEQLAESRMDPGAYGYIAGSSGTESTAKANTAAFERWRIVPRMLRDVAVRDVSVELFGQRMASPLLLGPIGVLTIAHPEGEL